MMWGFVYLCEAIAIVSVSAIWDALKKTRRVSNWLVQREKNKQRQPNDRDFMR